MGVEKRKIIWSPNLAYAIGLITTDGSLSKDGRHIDFTSNDIELINNLKYCLKLENKIGKKLSGSTKKYSSFRIQFGDVLFYKWLLNIGLMPNKSKKLRSVKIPDKFFFDFLRGHLDGDGTIKRYNDPVYRNSLRLYISFVSASLSHILWIKQKITKLAGIKGFMRKKCGNGVYDLTFGKKESIVLSKLLYYSADIPHLERKFFRVKDFLEKS